MNVMTRIVMGGGLACATLCGCGDDGSSNSDGQGSGDSDASEGEDAEAGDVGGRDASADTNASNDSGSSDAAAGEVPFGLFGSCTLALGGAPVFVLGQSPTRLYSIAGLTCEVTGGAETYDAAPLDLEQDGTNAYYSTESQIVVAPLAGLGATATLEQERPVLANGLGLLVSASVSGPVLNLTEDLTELSRSEDTELIELIGCVDVATAGAAIYGLCSWNANSELYEGVLEFTGNPLRPSILFNAAPGSRPRSIALVDSTVYLLETTQPAIYTIAPGVDPVATDLSATFPVSDGVSSLSGEIFAVGGDVWLTTTGDERGQLYSLSLGEFTRTGDAGSGIPDVDIHDIAQLGFSGYVVAVTPWVEALDDGRRVEGMQLLEIEAGSRQVVGRAAFNGISPAFVR